MTDVPKIPGYLTEIDAARLAGVEVPTLREWGRLEHGPQRIKMGKPGSNAAVYYKEGGFMHEVLHRGPKPKRVGRKVEKQKRDAGRKMQAVPKRAAHAWASRRIKSARATIQNPL